jgi:Lrp/AsnC family transcriptional regulator, leucine-responsive regulatory protein
MCNCSKGVTTLDEKDNAILEALYMNSRLSCREIAKKTSIPVMTVLNRIKKLEENEIILKYTIKVNHEKIGYKIIAYVLVSIDYNYVNELKISQEGIAEQIFKHPLVTVADLITGPDRDLLVKVKCRSLAELNQTLDDIRAIKGVNRTDTMTNLYETGRACFSRKKFKKQANIITSLQTYHKSY